MKTKTITATASCLIAALALTTPSDAGELWIAHGGGGGGSHPNAGDVGVYTAPAGFTMVQDYTRVSGLAYGNGVVYAYVPGGNGQQGTLKTIDPITGNEIGSILEPLNNFAFDTGSSHAPLGDLAFDPTTNTLYGSNAWGSTGDGHEYHIYTIDPTDASRTFVGSAEALFEPTSGYDISIAFTDDGRLFAMQYAETLIAELDKSDASVVNSGNYSLPNDNAVNGGVGLGFDSDTGLLVGNYFSQSTNASDLHGLMTIDPDTFATTTLGEFDDNRQIHDITFVPEPTSLALLGLGGLLLTRRRRG